MEFGASSAGAALRCASGCRMCLRPLRGAIRRIGNPRHRLRGVAIDGIDKARRSFKEGDDRRAPLACQTESPTWRNAFLTGALALRHGTVRSS